MNKIKTKIKKILSDLNKEDQETNERIRLYYKRVKENPKSEAKLFLYRASNRNKKYRISNMSLAPMMLGLFLIAFIGLGEQHLFSRMKHSMTNIQHYSDYCTISEEGESCIDKMKKAEAMINDPERKKLINSYGSKDILSYAFSNESVKMMTAVLDYDIKTSLENNPEDKELALSYPEKKQIIDDALTVTNEQIFNIKSLLFFMMFFPLFLEVLYMATISSLNKKYNGDILDKLDSNTKDLEEAKRNYEFELFGIKKETP